MLPPNLQTYRLLEEDHMPVVYSFSTGRVKMDALTNNRSRHRDRPVRIAFLWVASVNGICSVLQQLSLYDCPCSRYGLHTQAWIRAQHCSLSCAAVVAA